MTRRPAFLDAPRCAARSKRTGRPCGAPAMRGWRVCRNHGAGGGAPKGLRNGRFKTGLHTKDMEAARREVRELSRAVRAALGLIEEG